MTETRRGLLFGVAAYLMWGLFPLYWPLLEPAVPLEILSHRIVWSLLVVGGILAVRRSWAWLPALGARRLGLLTVAAIVIAVNWGTYIYGVNSGHVVETSLGYFVNPLVTVALGVLVLRETLRPVQWASIGLATLAVVVLTIDYGRPPWIALVLAFSFGTYGLLKKTAGVGAAESLTVETAVLVVPALAYLGLLAATGAGTFSSQGPGHALLLVGCGVVTAIPLLCFSAAATRVPLVSIGLLQYLAPVLQFLLGIVVYDEHMPGSRWLGFALVWGALVLLSADAVGAARRAARARALARAAAALT